MDRNIHSFTPQNGKERCCLCLAYAGPLLLLFIICSFVGGYLAYFIKLSMKYPNSWRLAVCIVCILVGVVIWFLLVLALKRTVFTAAGYVPRTPWQYPPRYVGNCPGFVPPPASSSGENLYTVRCLDRHNQLRYCAACEQFKPDKAYHCSYCSRCTFNFDHHCPVLNNCIGRDNYKMFVLFLNYIPVAGCILGGLVIVGSFKVDEGGSSVSWVVFAVVLMVFSIAVGSFGWAHLCWLYRGESTMGRHVRGYDRNHVASKAERELEREGHCADVCGVGRTWWRLVIPVPPLRETADSVV